MSKKPILFTQHATLRLARGATADEVIACIQKAPWRPTTQGRWECLWEFPFEGYWNGKRYNRKQVRPIFVEKTDAIVVITVYVYFLPKGGVKEENHADYL
ncbi:DUF4258 domain-containing protein [Thermus caldifontis]|uniref:DUF4258 domain-containing protein n=1 Tax=Thermus caldifontis TaxID=1930763 RepID=UPI000DF3D476|nr:DUF4258 domain-containing protein [Thermus caldifontis]